MTKTFAEAVEALSLSARTADLSGKKFGKLTPLYPVGRKGAHVAWLVRCDCGTEKVIASNILQRSKGCGCHGRWSGYIKAPRRGVEHLDSINVENAKPTLPITWAIEAGTAGEHIACADLILSGRRAFLTSAGLPYDIIVDVEGRLLRIAVKSTRGPRMRAGRPDSRASYKFAVTKTGSKRYTSADADIAAMVSIDTRRVAYLPLAECGSAVEILAEHVAPASNAFGPRRRVTKTFSDLTFERALSSLLGEPA
jgi:hypothetical protein